MNTLPRHQNSEKILSIFSDVNDFSALSALQRLLLRSCPEVDQLASDCIRIYTSIIGMANQGMLTAFNTLQIMQVAGKFSLIHYFMKNMIILNITLFPDNLKAAGKQCRDRRVRNPLLHSESCRQVTFGLSFNLSRLLFLIYYMKGSGQMMTQLPLQDSRHKEPLENKSSGTTAMTEGNLSCSESTDQVGEASGPSWMNTKESLVFISQVGWEDSTDNLCQTLSPMHGIHD